MGDKLNGAAEVLHAKIEEVQETLRREIDIKHNELLTKLDAVLSALDVQAP